MRLSSSSSTPPPDPSSLLYTHPTSAHPSFPLPLRLHPLNPHPLPPSVLLLPSDLVFGLAAALFYLQSLVSCGAASVQMSDMQAKCDSIFGRITTVMSEMCVVLGAVKG
ncbi:hypothetical protein ACFX13_046705 [Malus domestica]